MAQSDRLFDLVQTLTKSEKRNFRLYVKRLQSNQDVLFVRLFDVLEKLDTYDEHVINRKMKGVSKSQLANLKRHLYTQILKSLRLIHIEKNIDIQIREQIDHAKILYERGLYLQGLKLLERIKTIAIDSHQDMLAMEILEFQKFIEERHITRSRATPGKMEALLKQADDLEKNISNLIQLSNLKIKIHGLYITMGHARNKKDNAYVRRYFQTELAGIREQTLSITEQVYLHQSYMWYFYILLDFENCYEHAAKWSRVFEEYPKMMRDDPVLYMRGISYELSNLYRMGAYEKYIAAMERFENFASANEKRFTTTQRIIQFLYINTARLNRHFLEGSFEEGITLVRAIERQLKQYHNMIDVHRIMVFHYRMAWLFFGVRDYDKAVHYLNEIINLKASHLREDIQCYARLLHLIAHYELGHNDYLQYHVETVARFFNKMQDLNAIQRAILAFFRRHLTSPEEKREKALIELKDQVIRLSKRPYEKRAFYHLDILAWIDSQLQKVSVAEIIRTRFSARH